MIGDFRQAFLPMKFDRGFLRVFARGRQNENGALPRPIRKNPMYSVKFCRHRKVV
jgi:hypothetical protein